MEKYEMQLTRRRTIAILLAINTDLYTVRSINITEIYFYTRKKIKDMEINSNKFLPF